MASPCDNCGEPATVHLTRIVGKEKHKVHLCQQCADKQDLLKKQVLQIHNVLHALMGPMPLATLACPACRIQFMEFRNIGRLGCPHDYDSLRQGLEEIIRRLQGARKHIGKRPSLLRADTEANRVVVTLRRELQEAVQAEDYGQAVLLRDQIRNAMQTIQESQ
ncbi:MAG: UvrB/UvrC motif-containing protein [Gemmataceae bacterium]